MNWTDARERAKVWGMDRGRITPPRMRYRTHDETVRMDWIVFRHSLEFRADILPQLRRWAACADPSPDKGRLRQGIEDLVEAYGQGYKTGQMVLLLSR